MSFQALAQSLETRILKFPGYICQVGMLFAKLGVGRKNGGSHEEIDFASH